LTLAIRLSPTEFTFVSYIIVNKRITDIMNKKPNSIEFPSPFLISVNGIVLEVFEAGKQNIGKPIVLCHAFAVPSENC
jgi:hypothetical protein